MSAVSGFNINFKIPSLCAHSVLGFCVVATVALGPAQVLETVGRFHLMFALQLLRCPFLNPRIRGVTLLSDIIDHTVRSGAR